MSDMQHPRGGLPVGHVADLGPVEIRAVQYMRLWFAGPKGQDLVRDDIASCLGGVRGREVVADFEVLCNLCVQYGRRPFMRHCVDCQCLGADESCFANFVGYAGEGAREDAFLMAVHMVRPDIAASLVDLAMAFGLALKCMARRAENVPERFAGTTIH